MKYALITIGMILLAAGLLAVFSTVTEFRIPGSLLTIAAAIFIAAGSILDRIDRRI